VNLSWGDVRCLSSSWNTAASMLLNDSLRGDVTLKIEEAPYTEPRRQIMKQMCDTMRRGVEAGHGTNSPGFQGEE
jgi:hypothetical protein